MNCFLVLSYFIWGVEFWGSALRGRILGLLGIGCLPCGFHSKLFFFSLSLLQSKGGEYEKSFAPFVCSCHTSLLLRSKEA